MAGCVLTKRRLLPSKILFYCINLSQKPVYLYNKIAYITDLHNISIQKKSFVTVSTYRTALFDVLFIYPIAEIYNQIPSIVNFKIKFARQVLIEQGNINSY